MTSVNVRTGRVVWWKRPYVPIAALITVIALVGFWPTYFSLLLKGTLDKVPVIHLHAAVFSGWLVLVIAQATLAGRGHISMHRKLGKVVIAYGVVLIVVGLVTAISQFALRVNAGHLEVARGRLFAPLTDMLFFAPVLWAAWAYRNKPETHKRLVVVATTILLVAAVHRMTIFGGPPPPAPLLLATWLSPIAVGMAHDLLAHRLVHRAYLVGIVLILLMKVRDPLIETHVWRDLTAWLATVIAQ